MRDKVLGPGPILQQAADRTRSPGIVEAEILPRLMLAHRPAAGRRAPGGPGAERRGRSPSSAPSS
ncbi:hypothetical protein ACU4GR_17510 [Methylobacterium oryzae CBMB20]